MTLAKAYLLTEKNEKIEFQFNPAELTVSKANSWQASEAKGVNAPDQRFQTGQPGTLTFNLILDTTHDHADVTTHTNKLFDLMMVDADLAGSDRQRNKARPPWVEFHWGAMHSFKAFVERLQIKFIYFSNSGMPLRAKVDIALKQFQDEKKRPLQNPTSHTPDAHALHRVVHGETLDRIAASYYADPARWRLIAEANAVVDPFHVAPGALLVIPEIPVRRRG